MGTRSSVDCFGPSAPALLEGDEVDVEDGSLAGLHPAQAGFLVEHDGQRRE